MALTTDRVRAVMKDVLFRDDEMPADGEVPFGAVVVDGVLNRYAFHPTRLEELRAEIIEMLSELPDEFRADGGGGWSFLNACLDRHGNHWAEHPTIEQLLVLGIGVDAAQILMPREMWAVLPGGLPYFSTKLAAAA